MSLSLLIVSACTDDIEKHPNESLSEAERIQQEAGMSEDDLNEYYGSADESVDLLVEGENFLDDIPGQFNKDDSGSVEDVCSECVQIDDEIVRVQTLQADEFEAAKRKYEKDSIAELNSAKQSLILLESVAKGIVNRVYSTQHDAYITEENVGEFKADSEIILKDIEDRRGKEFKEAQEQFDKYTEQLGRLDAVRSECTNTCNDSELTNSEFSVITGEIQVSTIDENELKEKISELLGTYETRDYSTSARFAYLNGKSWYTDKFDLNIDMSDFKETGVASVTMFQPGHSQSSVGKMTKGGRVYLEGTGTSEEVYDGYIFPYFMFGKYYHRFPNADPEIGRFFMFIDDYALPQNVQWTIPLNKMFENIMLGFDFDLLGPLLGFTVNSDLVDEKVASYMEHALSSEFERYKSDDQYILSFPDYSELVDKFISVPSDIFESYPVSEESSTSLEEDIQKDLDSGRLDPLGTKKNNNRIYVDFGF
jgi:hypothetical protein